VLISFEGIDGCGKSTQIDLLKEHFEKSEKDYYVFREPGGTELSEKIRNLLLHEDGEMNPVTELLLFSAARSQLISEKVTPLLSSGKIVILDRFYDSTTAYQGYGRESAELHQIENLNELASLGTVPDLTFYLKIDPGEAALRTAGGKKDRMESSGLDFFSKVAAGYDLLSDREERFVVLDASLDPIEIHKLVVERIGQIS
jgi:dTMP kinase